METIKQYKIYAILILIIIGLSTALVLKSSPDQVVTTQEIKKEEDKKEDKKEKTITVIDKKPDGETVTTQVTQEEDQTEDKTKEDTKTQTTVINKSTNISLMYAPSFKPVYGVSITHEVLGPFTVGAFVLTNGTLGVTVGVSF